MITAAGSRGGAVPPTCQRGTLRMGVDQDARGRCEVAALVIGVCGRRYCAPQARHGRAVDSIPAFGRIMLSIYLSLLRGWPDPTSGHARVQSGSWGLIKLDSHVMLTDASILLAPIAVSCERRHKLQLHTAAS